MAVISYKCPNCEGELIFDPSSQNYKCEYCISSFSLEELEQMKPETTTEQVVEIEQPEMEKKEGTETQEAIFYSCPSCGAEIVTDSTTAATFCYYCHNPVVLSGRLSGEYMPDRIIPFAIDKKQAEKQFLEYVHSKKFIPRAFFKKQQIEKLSGVYFPYWIYECSMEGSMQAQGTNIRIWRNGDIEYTERKYYHVERQGSIELSNLAKNALQKANQKLITGVFPFDMTQMKEFHMSYLSGFQAEKRDIAKEALRQEITQEVNGYGEKLLRDTISGYSAVNVENHTLRTVEEIWNYVLLPVWTLTYKGKNGKLYYYSMNGQNGKVFGELPVDYKKVCLLGGVVALIVLIIGLLGGYFL